MMIGWPDEFTLAAQLDRAARVPVDRMGPASRSKIAAGLAAERHTLMLAGMDERWWQLRARRRRRARIAELERELGMTATRKGPA